MRFVLAAVLTVITALPLHAATDIQEVSTPGGFQAWLVEEHSIPFVALELRFKGGTSLDLPGKRGATYLMSGLLEEGAGDYDARGFAEAVESLAAEFDYGAYDDSVSVSARFLTENRDQAVALLRDSLINPHFADEDIARVKAQVLSGIQSDLKNPDAIATRHFDEIAFGSHPYGSPKEGTALSVNSLTRDDMVAAHKGVMARDRVFISASGDITPQELSDLIDDLLVELPQQGLPMPELVDVKMPGGTIVVPFDTPQSVVQFGHSGIARDDPDFFAAYVMNVILGGGGFEARLMNEVREKRGLTYGVNSYLVAKDFGSLYVGRVASANERVAEAIDVIRSEWARLREDGVTQEELTRAQTYLTGSYPLRFDGNGSIANILVGMQMDNLPVSYVRTRNDRVSAVTLADVKRVAARILKPDAFTCVVVGKPVGILEASYHE